VAVHRGVIVAIEEPPTQKRAILRVTLADGRRVYVPRLLWEQALAHMGNGAEYIFVERGLLGRTCWVGTWEEVPFACAASDEIEDAG